jgi:hypothetical protein
MRNTILIVILSLVVFGCSKDKSASNPVLEYKSVNTTVLQYGQYINFTLSFTDTNGDADSLFIKNVNTNCPASNFADSVLLPAFPSSKKLSGDITVSFGNGVNDNAPLLQPPLCSENDTCYFLFVLKDLSGKRSDTVKSPTIVINYK